MEPLKRWDEKVKDLGTVDMGDLGAYRFQGSRCVRFDGKSLGIGYIGKTLNDCKKFREEFVRVGCFCWSTKELCYGVPMCPIHPHGICGVDMEMRRADTVQDGDAFGVMELLLR